MAQYRGIDVSKWNGTIDWNRVKAAGIDFAMIRAGYGKEHPNQIDKKFKQNIEGAQAAGIPVGVYHYSYADSVEDAKKEAQFCLKIIAGYQLGFPVVYDIEDREQLRLTNSQRTELCKAFCEEIENNNYYAMIYTNPNWLDNYLIRDELKPYDLWLAHWGVDKPKYECGIWQTTDKGRVDGITTNVDLDISYVDYPSIMKSKGLNGFKKTAGANKTEVTPEKPEYITYVIKTGDTLWNIAKKYLGNGARYTEIKKLNSLKGDTIFPGQKLKIKVK